MFQGPHYNFGTAFQLELIFIFVSLHCEPICISFKMVTDCLMPIYQTRTFETEIPFQLKVVIHAKRAYKYVRNCIAFVIHTYYVCWSIQKHFINSTIWIDSLHLRN